MSYVVPTIFTAVDNYTVTMMKMIRVNGGFAQSTDIAMTRANRSLNNLVPALGNTTKQLIDYAKSAVGITAITQLFYQTGAALKEYENNVQSFRGIVSDLTNVQFERYKKQLNSVARETKESAGQTFFAAEKIAALNAEFAKTPEGMVEMTRQAITLARASDGQLGPAAENLVGIMNQFGLQATEAARAADVLAAGEQVGAASIAQSAEAYKNFGAVANGANITLEQSQALIQTLGKFMVLGAEAGTGLKTSISRLQDAGLGYASGQFQINDALKEAKDRMDKLATAKQKDAFISKTFGLLNKNVGSILLNNIDVYKNFTAAVTGTNAAQELAAIKTNSVTESARQLWNTWTNIITTSDNMTSGMRMLSSLLQLLARNLDTIVFFGGLLIGTWLAMKVAILAVNTVLGAYYIGLGYVGAMTGFVNIAVGKSVVALKAYRIALALSHPIGLLSLALVGLAGAFIAVNRTHSRSAILANVNSDIQKETIERTIQERATVERLFATLKKQTAGTEDYKATLQQLNGLQPGIVAQYNLERGAITDLNKAHKDLIATLERRAKMQATSELYTQSVKDRLMLEQQSQDLSGQGIFAQFLQGFYDYDNTLDQVNKRLQDAKMRESILLNKVGDSNDLLNPEGVRQDSLMQILERTNNAKVTIDNKTGMDVKSDQDFVTTKTSPSWTY